MMAPRLRSARARSRRASFVVAALLGWAAVSVPCRGARAETPPSTWDMARDPAERARWALHVRVQRLMRAPPGDDSHPLDDELRLEAAREALEEADAAHSPDVRLQFDLGVVYSRLATRLQRLDYERRVVDVLVPALAAAPDDPASTGALEALVYAYAKLDRPREELEAWRRYIPRLNDDRVRAMAMMNMGEAEMRLGAVADALATFRDVLRMCGELPNGFGVMSTYVLTLWDLGVALDRSGDPRGALDAAAKASHVAIGGKSGAFLIAEDPDVFFVPEWERDWYLALGAAAEGRDADDPRAAAVLWGAAERFWGRYVDLSAAAQAKAVRQEGEPWLVIARVRRDHAHAERLNAEARAAKLPRRAAPRTPWTGPWTE
jgi:tetratricopeptide (TPR) repeat protein